MAKLQIYIYEAKASWIAADLVQTNSSLSHAIPVAHMDMSDGLDSITEPQHKVLGACSLDMFANTEHTRTVLKLGSGTFRQSQTYI